MMSEHLIFIDGLLARIEGPMSLRLLPQTLVALFFSFWDGRKDAREGRLPYFGALFTKSGQEHDFGLFVSDKKYVELLLSDRLKVYFVQTVTDWIIRKCIRRPRVASGAQFEKHI
jgi:hypothetical protein